MPKANESTLRSGGTLLTVGGALNVVSAVVVGAVAASSTVPDDLMRAPWSESAYRVFVAYAVVLHAVILLGLVRLRGSGWLPDRPAVRTGLGAAIAGTAFLVLAEVLSLTVANVAGTDGNGALVSAVYGVSSLVAVVGMIAVGISARRAGASPAPLVCGLLSVPVLFLPAFALTWAGVLFYGVGFTILGAAMVGATRAAESQTAPLRAHAAD